MTVRALALVIVLALLWFAPQLAHAGNKEQEYQNCQAKIGELSPGRPGHQWRCLDAPQPPPATGGRWHCQMNGASTGGTWAQCIGTTGLFIYTACPAGTAWIDDTKTCGTPCSVRPSFTGGFTPPNGSLGCTAGCRVQYGYNGDGTSTATHTGGQCMNDTEPTVCQSVSGYYWHPNLNVCAPTEPEECEPGQTPKEGVCQKPEQCPDGMVTDENGLCKPKDNECPAGKTKGPDGSCVDSGECPEGQAKGKDGTCKPDANDDGTPDEEDSDPENDPDKKSFSGGDDCNNPPSCSGDAIMCGQARIQWRIECNTRRSVNIAGGTCEAVPVCTGEKCNAMEYAQLLQQWRTSCAVQKLAAGEGTGPATGDGNGNGVPDVMEGTVGEGSGAEPGVGEVDGGALWSQVDRAGWLGGGSCRGLAPFQFAGKTYDLGSKPCEQVALLGQLIVAAAMVAAAYIIGRAASGG